MNTPMSYAVRLCSYIASPTKIESLIEREFGKGKAPPLHIIAGIRLKVEVDKKKFSNRGETTRRELQREIAKIKKDGPRKIKTKPHHKCSGDRIIALVCNHFMCCEQGFYSRTKFPNYLTARFVAAKLFQDAGFDREETGIHMRRDKSRVGKMLRGYDAQAEEYPKIVAAYDKLRPIVMGEA